MSSVPSLIDSQQYGDEPVNRDLDKMNDLSSHPSSNLIIGEASVSKNNMSKQPSMQLATQESKPRNSMTSALTSHLTPL